MVAHKLAHIKKVCICMHYQTAFFCDPTDRLALYIFWYTESKMGPSGCQLDCVGV
jgi:hypothetical protein